MLAEEGFVHHADGQWNWTNESYPADAVSLRSVSSDNFVVVDMHAAASASSARPTSPAGRRRCTKRRSTSSKGSCSRWSASTSTGARPMCARSIATTTPTRSPIRRSRFSTRSRREAGIATVRLPARIRMARSPEPRRSAGVPRPGRPRPSAIRSHGEVHVVSRVVGFKKIKFYTNENVGSGELDLPEQQMHTSSYWLTIPADGDGVAAVRRRRPPRRRRRACVRDEEHRAAAADVRRSRHRPVGRRRYAERSTRTGGIGGVPDALATEPNVFIYDNYPGGIGFSRPLFEMHARCSSGRAT